MSFIVFAGVGLAVYIGMMVVMGPSFRRKGPFFLAFFITASFFAYGAIEFGDPLYIFNQVMLGNATLIDVGPSYAAPMDAYGISSENPSPEPVYAPEEPMPEMNTSYNGSVFDTDFLDTGDLLR
jgi:hypothetical protein